MSGIEHQNPSQVQCYFTKKNINIIFFQLKENERGERELMFRERVARVHSISRSVQVLYNIFSIKYRAVFFTQKLKYSELA